MDLFVLAADKNVEYALKGALERHQALGMRKISFETRVHVGRDGGVRTSGADILALERDNHEAVLMVFDFEGCGFNNGEAIDLELMLDLELVGKVGLKAKAIVIEPEADIWMWGSDNFIVEALGWNAHLPPRAWLQERGFEFDGNDKPLRPKEALESLVREGRRPRSSALYRQMAGRISLARCRDPSFTRLRDTLQRWFPE